MPEFAQHNLLDGNKHIDTVAHLALTYGEIVIGKMVDHDNDPDTPEIPLWSIFPFPTGAPPRCLCLIGDQANPDSATVDAREYRVQFGGKNEGIPDDASTLFVMSLTWDATSHTIRLVNDEDDPGALKYYGTDDHGNKGWHPLPGTGTGSTPKSHPVMYNDSCEGGFHDDVAACDDVVEGGFITSDRNTWVVISSSTECTYVRKTTHVEFGPIDTPKHVKKSGCSLQLHNDTAAAGTGNRPWYYGTLKGGDDGWHKLPVVCTDGGGGGGPGDKPEDLCKTGTGDSDCNGEQPGNPGKPDPSGGPKDPCARGGEDLCQLFPGWPNHPPSCDADLGGLPDGVNGPGTWANVCPTCCYKIFDDAGGLVSQGNNCGECACTEVLMNAKHAKENRNVLVFACFTPNGGGELESVVCKGCCVWEKVGNAWSLLFGGCKRRFVGGNDKSCTCDPPHPSIPGPFTTTSCKDIDCRAGGGGPNGPGGITVSFPNGGGGDTRIIGGGVMGLLHATVCTAGGFGGGMLVGTVSVVELIKYPCCVAKACGIGGGNDIDCAISLSQKDVPGCNITERQEVTASGCDGNETGSPTIVFTHELTDFHKITGCDGGAGEFTGAGQGRDIYVCGDNNWNANQHAHIYPFLLPIRVV